MVERICDLCKNKMDLSHNQQGLVFEDRIFICEDCCKHTSENVLTEWSQSVMHVNTSGMPICLWLIHEENKGRPLFTKIRP